jgi:DNA-binding response OmpR family regulator
MNGPAKILVVEDEKSIRFYLKEVLEHDNYVVKAVATGEEALRLIHSEIFNLAMIDLKLPGIDGMQVLKNIRSVSPQTTVIILTAHASVETAVDALRLGAYDYLFKPCKTDEIRACVASGLQKGQREAQKQQLLSQLESDLSSRLDEIRAAREDLMPAPTLKPQEKLSSEHCIKWKELVVDLDRHTITWNGTLLELSPTEFKLLAYLAGEAPRVVPPQELIRQVHGYESSPWEARDLARYHIYRIRQKISRATGIDNLVQNVHGVGYTLSEKN